ncbi:MAG: hypothetical protein AAGA66_04000 [Bacteroidota bacterium]
MPQLLSTTIFSFYLVLMENITFFMTQGAIIFVIFMFYLRLKKKAKKEIENLRSTHLKLVHSLDEAEFDLSKKSRQLSSMSIQIMTINTKIDESIKKININARDINRIQKEVKQFDKELKSLRHSWESLKIHFESIHPGFFKTLEEQFPSVSQNDLKICAFLKMNMSNKEISELMNITLGGVNQSKRRLKKKLGLNPEDKLKNFIAKIDNRSLEIVQENELVMN